MKRFLKFIAILIILAHVFAGLVYTGIIPLRVLQILHIPDFGSVTDLLSDRQEEAVNNNVSVREETDETSAEEEEKGQETESQVEEADLDIIQIELSDTLPELTEEDLYNLSDVLIEAGALTAVDGRGEDHSDQIICDLAADINDPGRFTAVFSVEAEDGQIQRGPSAEFRVELVEPFLAFRESEVTIPLDSDYNPYTNILICMDVDGTVLTEFVAQEGFLDTSQAGDYDIRFYIYSRVNASSASRTMTAHVIGQ